MYLTKEEERIYDGEFGWANQICMKILVRLGELFNATRLIPVSSTHVSGVSYKTLGDAPTEFLEALAEAGGKVKVKSTLNPQSFDPKYLRYRLKEEMVKKQLKLLEQFEKMGFSRSLTCTPYYLERPQMDSHLAWAESSAVVYSNSVLKAWTNREGGPSALAAAIIGKTPDYGMHRAENREPKALVRLETEFDNETEFGALGIYLGKILEDRIPMIYGLQNASEDYLKQLGAALASTGMVNMFYYENGNGMSKIDQKLTIGDEDIKRTMKDLSTASTSEPELVFIGCPHCSQDEIRKIASLTEDKKVKKGIECWICTSRHVKEETEEYVRAIEKSGCRVITDTCAVVTWTDMLGIKTIMTNSAKTAHYAPTLNKAEATLSPLKKCLKTALEE